MATAYNDVPFGEPCERIEGSSYVNPCTKGVPRPNPSSSNTSRPASKEITLRRYVIDEVMGSADVLCSFTSVGTIPDSHEMRIQNGKVRYVHTITLCATDDGPTWGPTQCRKGKDAGKSTRRLRRH